MRKPSELAQFLKSRRIHAGYSQKRVAELMGYTTPQFVSNWERGQSNPPLKAVKKLASLYNISIDELYEIALRTTLEVTSTNLRKKFYGRKKA